MKAVAILSAISAVTLVSAGTLHTPLKIDAQIIPHGYIIEYEDGFQHDLMLETLSTNHVKFDVRKAYSIFNGAAIDVKSAHEGQDLASLPNVKNVWPITVHSIPKVRVSEVDSSEPDSLHEMTGMDIVSSQYNLTGRGIKVGVIDTGIDYKHPAFAVSGASAGCLGGDCRTIVGWDFVGDEYDGRNSPVPDADPMDCNGHGTHVAGIVGANAMNITDPAPPVPFVGVAPEVTFGAYRIFGCDGGSGDDIIMAAMERAFVDGMDIINMSLGGGSAYMTNPQAVLGDKLIARGVSLVVAAGNDGEDGVWMVSDVSLGNLSSSIASFDNIYTNNYYLTYDDTSYPYKYSQGYGRGVNISGTTLVPIYSSDGTLANGCDPNLYTGIDVRDKVVLVLGDNGCHSGEMGIVADNLGAAAILLQADTAAGLAELGGLRGYPMGSVSRSTGEALQASYKNEASSILTWSNDQKIFRADGGGGPSDFSSYGVDGDLRSKPDFAGPGGNILSTYPLELGGYAVLSGTSMATPYVAGSHAIYMQYKGGRVPGNTIRQVFKNTATIYQNNVTFAVPSNTTSNEALSTTYASAVKQGAGLINVLRAITTTTSITPDHINLLDTINFVSNSTITITNTGNQSETYTLSHIATDALNSYPTDNTFPLTVPELQPNHATVTFTETTVNIAAGASVNVTIHFVEPDTGDAATFPLYSGYVIATPTISQTALPVSIPYIGMKGSIAQVPIMDTDSGYPMVMSIDFYTANISSIDNQTTADGTNLYTFDFRRARPVIQTRLGSHTPSLEIRIFDLQDNFLGYAEAIDKPAIGPSGRDKNLDLKGDIAFTNWIWGGRVVQNAQTTRTTTLPSGEYKFVVATQRKFTAGNYPGDYDVFTIGNIKF
ncbi:hypothetical protein BGZ76_001648 [Entomortierella beljakovae]|nr:hypothetical protein BGZ76_001648 [Entomortierella beljakovae]